MKIGYFVYLVIYLLLFACTQHLKKDEKVTFEYSNDADEFLNLNESDRNNIDSLFFLLQAKLPKVEIDSVQFYVVEGDLLLDVDELYNYCQNRIDKNLTDSSVHPLKLDQKEFTVLTLNGEKQKWPKDYIVKFSILRKSFDSKELYDSTVAFMKSAIKSWMDVCNVRFEYLPEYDNSDIVAVPPFPLTFYVRQFNSGGAFIAKAFFPHESNLRRKILIDVNFFSPNLNVNKTGILRHELGHVLGARHEHIWSPDSECQGEAVFSGIIGGEQLTDYDPYSVMHYLCGSGGTRTLELTDFDIQGAQSLYGKKQ